MKNKYKDKNNAINNEDDGSVMKFTQTFLELEELEVEEINHTCNSYNLG